MEKIIMPTKSIYSYRQERKGRGREILEHRRKMLILIAVMLFIGICLGAVLFVIYKTLEKSDFFQITAINIHGCRRTNKKLILGLSGIDIYSNLFALKSDRVRKKIAAHEWIEDVAIEKEWPNHLKIMVTERVPVAIMSVEQELYYLDSKGAAFSRVQPPDDMDYPVITGLTKDKLPKTVNDSALTSALQFIRFSEMGDSVLPKQNISEINLTADDAIVVFLVNRPFPIYLGKGNIKDKYYRLAKVLYWLYKKKEFTVTNYIKMDYQDNKVLVGKN